MSRLCFLVALALVNSFVTAQYYGPSQKWVFESNEIVPDVLDVAPPSLVHVVYPDSAPLSVGEVLTPTQVKPAPEVTWEIAPLKFCTFVMIDLDAPSRKQPKLREWLHWLVVNVPFDIVQAGDTLAEYIGAGPGKGSGLHRYVFLVYQQPGRIMFDEPRLTNRSMANRAYFSVSKFAKKYNLGNPIAGNFFQAEWDDYVPILYMQLGAEHQSEISGCQRSTMSSMVVLTSFMMLVLNI